MSKTYKIKPLYWESLNHVGAVEATIFGGDYYEVTKNENKTFSVKLTDWDYGSDTLSSTCSSIEEAKQLAWNDYVENLEQHLTIC